MKSFSDFNGLKDGIKRAFTEKVEPVDMLVGAVAGVVAGKAVGAMLVKNFAGKSEAVDKVLVPYSDVIGGSLVGIGLYAAQKGQGRAKGHLVGAVIGSALPVVTTKLVAMAQEAKLPGFGLLRPMGYLTRESFGLLERESMNGFQGFQGLGDFQGHGSNRTAMAEEQEEYL